MLKQVKLAITAIKADPDYQKLNLKRQKALIALDVKIITDNSFDDLAKASGILIQACIKFNANSASCVPFFYTRPSIFCEIDELLKKIKLMPKVANLQDERNKLQIILLEIGTAKAEDKGININGVNKKRYSSLDVLNNAIDEAMKLYTAVLKLPKTQPQTVQIPSAA